MNKHLAANPESQPGYPHPAELMLHRLPMLLIDRIVDFQTGHLISEVDILQDKTFFDSDLAGVPTWVGVEYMAQSVAALSGMAAKGAGEPILLGMLVSARRYTVNVPLFAVGCTLQVEVEELAGADTGMAAYRCSIRDKTSGEPLAAGQLGVYQRSADAGIAEDAES